MDSKPLPPEPPPGVSCPLHEECLQIPTLFRPRLRHVVEVSMRNVIPPLDTLEHSLDAETDTDTWNGESSSSAEPPQRTVITGSSDASPDYIQHQTTNNRSKSSLSTRGPDDLGQPTSTSLAASVNLCSLPSSFFRISIPSRPNPLYESEIVEHSSNPTWLPLLDRIGDTVGLRAGLILFSAFLVKESGKDGGKGKERETVALYEDLEIDLAGLVYIGKDLSAIRLLQVPNELVFLLKDGYYVYCADCAYQRSEQLPHPFRVDESRTQRSYDPSHILRLNQSQSLISTALHQLSSLRSQVSQRLSQLDSQQAYQKQHDEQLSKTGERERDVVLLMLEMDAEEQKLREKKGELEERRGNLKRVKEDVEKRRAELEERVAGQAGIPWVVLSRVFTSLRSSFAYGFEQNAHRPTLSLVLSQLRTRRAVLVRQLSEIYPIQPFKPTTNPSSSSPQPQAHQFTINGIHLPSSDSPPSSFSYSTQSEEDIATALGYVSHVLLVLSGWMGVQLRYPVECRSSRSSIRDEISREHRGDVVFPLYAYGQDRFRYGYAVFLLNKDIEQLMNHAGLTATNLRHTLPNLYMLVKALQREPGATPTGGGNGQQMVHSVPASPSSTGTWK